MILYPRSTPPQPTNARRSARLNTATLAALACFIAGPALADSRMEGRFQGRGEGQLALSVFAMGLDNPDAGYFVLAETSVRNECSGDLRGIARRVNDTTLRLTRKPEDAEESCELTLRFSADRSLVQMTAKSCSGFHGAS